jgi:hypothetical protein
MLYCALASYAAIAVSVLCDENLISSLNGPVPRAVKRGPKLQSWDQIRFGVYEINLFHLGTVEPH